MTDEEAIRMLRDCEGSLSSAMIGERWQVLRDMLFDFY